MNRLIPLFSKKTFVCWGFKHSVRNCIYNYSCHDIKVKCNNLSVPVIHSPSNNCLKWKQDYMTQSYVPCCLILYTKVQIPVTLKVHKPIKLLTKKLLFDVNNFFLQSHKPGHTLIVNTWAIYPAVLVYVQIRFSFHITYNEEFMLYCKKDLLVRLIQKTTTTGILL